MSDSLFSMISVDQLAWTLVHFLWQGVLIAAIGWLIQMASHRRNAQTRYAIWLGTLLAMALAPACTLYLSSVEQESLVAADSGVSREDGHVQELLTELMASLHATPDETSESVVAELHDTTAADAQLPASVFWQNWQAWVVIAWSLGVVLCSLRMVGAATWMWYLVSRLEPAPAAVQTTMEQLCERLGLSRLPRLSLSAAIQEPLAMYWFRPMILLPASWLADVTPSVLEAVLAHELAHIRRYDLWVNLGQRVIETLLFFHPCIWWVSKQIRVERELCCDAEAVRATGLPVQYAQALEVVARQRWACASPQLAVGMGGTRMALLHRVKQVLGVESSAAESQWWTLGLAGIGITAASWMGMAMWSSPVQGEEAEAVAFADDDRREEERELRPAPPPRREDREDGDRPRPPGPPEGREGPRPPREPDREDGPRPPGPPEGRGPREPHPEGRPGERPPRPIPEIVEELANALRQLDERGPEGMREKQEIIMHLMRSIHGPRGFGGPMVDGPGPGIHMRGPAQLHPEGDHPGPEMAHEMMQAVRELREEMGRMRAELNELREHRPPGPPRGPDFEGREGRPGPRPEGREGPPPRGPRDGEAGPPRGPRDGEGPRPRGPRDGEAGPPRGPRESEDARPRGPREEEGRRPPRDDDEEDEPVSADLPDA